MGLRFIALYLASLVGVVLAEYVSKREVLDSKTIHLDELNISQRGVLIDKSACNLSIYGQFLNEGAFYQSRGDEECLGTNGTPELSRTGFFVERYFSNKSKYIFEYRSAKVSPIFHVEVMHQIQNSGVLWLSVSGSGKSQKTVDFTFISNEFIENSGKIFFRGTESYTALVAMKSKDDDLNPLIVNIGQICMEHSRWEVTLMVGGSGCILVRESELILTGKRFPHIRQTVHLDAGNTESKLTINVGDGELNYALSVLGFAKNTFIDFTKPMKSMHYSLQGLLEIQHGRFGAYYFHIGSGYDPELFDFDARRITYKGEALQSATDRCSCNSSFAREPTH